LPAGSRLTAEAVAPGFEELRELGYFKAMAFPEVIRARLDSGALCHGFFLDGELVNIAWSSRGFLEMEPGVSICEGGCVGIFDCYTLPAHRSKGIYTDTLLLLIRAIGDEGGSTALIAVDPGNIPSIKGIERAGFKPLCRLTRVRRFGRQVLRRSEFRLRQETAS
jgi:GNAT superfamily N-acetyltransferase